MTFARRAPRRLALVAGLATAVVAAACGGSAGSPPSAVAPTLPVETPLDVPTFDLGTFALPSFAIPSFASDAELEALLPDSIGGSVVVKSSLAGDAIVNLPGGSALASQLDDLGATVDDVSVAIGSAGAGPTAIVVFAYRIAGVSADRIFEGLEAAMQSGQGGQVSHTTVSGRDVTQVTSGGETTYIYLADDVVFIVGGQLTAELLEDAISQLPGA